jgi:hypothetical protein
MHKHWKKSFQGFVDCDNGPDHRSVPLVHGDLKRHPPAPKCLVAPHRLHQAAPDIHGDGHQFNLWLHGHRLTTNFEDFSLLNWWRRECPRIGAEYLFIFRWLDDLRAYGPTGLPPAIWRIGTETDGQPRPVSQAAKSYQIFFIPPGSEVFTSSSAWSELTSTNRRRPTVVVMRCPVPINS